jgi:phosphoribosylformylglycinamidine cyclo-ligase
MNRYEDAGVNIRKGEEAVARIKEYCRSTFIPGVIGDVGGFAGGFRVPGAPGKVLLSSIDGVGTKVKVAILCDRHDTIGYDLVCHSGNDILVHGATPLFFLDYIAMGALSTERVAQLVEGIARGCREVGCALIGGETAEMPGLYAAGDYDLAGFIVGVVERGKLLTGARIRAGDVLMGLPSTGLHTNGYSLARKLLFEVAGYGTDKFLPELGCTVADELLKVHRSYLRPLKALARAGLLKGAAHITGGGITENTPRMLPAGLAAEVDTSAWPVLPVFELLRRLGDIPQDDYRRTFNLGIGMIVAVSGRDATQAERILKRLREKCYLVGRVAKLPRGGKPRVIYR